MTTVVPLSNSRPWPFPYLTACVPSVLLQVIELMGQDNLKLSSKQMEEIIELLDREKVLDLERRIEKALQKEAEDIAAAAAAEAAARDQQQKQLPEQKSGDEPPPKP